MESRKRKEIEEFKAKIADLERQLQEREGGKFREIEELRKKHAAELAEALKARQKIERDLEELRKKLAGDMKAMEMQLEQVKIYMYKAQHQCLAFIAVQTV